MNSTKLVYWECPDCDQLHEIIYRQFIVCGLPDVGRHYITNEEIEEKKEAMTKKRD